VLNVALSGKFPTMLVRAGVQAVRERNGFDFGIESFHVGRNQRTSPPFFSALGNLGRWHEAKAATDVLLTYDPAFTVSSRRVTFRATQPSGKNVTAGYSRAARMSPAPRCDRSRPMSQPFPPRWSAIRKVRLLGRGRCSAM
jgi:hypothetical protein